jgi:hypothetical protein
LAFRRHQAHHSGAANQNVKARLQADKAGNAFLWAVNVSPEDQTAKLTVNLEGLSGLGHFFRGQGCAQYAGKGCVDVSIPAKDAVIVALKTNL